MRSVGMALALVALAGGCRTAEPSNKVEPARSASAASSESGDVVAQVAPSPAAPASAPGSTSPPSADSTPPAATPQPQGYVLVYPGSSKTSQADETTQGNGERNRIVRRTTKDSMEQVAAFFSSKLGLQETLSLDDRKILTGALPGGGRVAVTLTRAQSETATTIEVVAVEKL